MGHNYTQKYKVWAYFLIVMFKRLTGLIKIGLNWLSYLRGNSLMHSFLSFHFKRMLFSTEYSRIGDNGVIFCSRVVGGGGHYPCIIRSRALSVKHLAIELEIR